MSGFSIQPKQWLSPAEWLQLQLAGDATCALAWLPARVSFDQATLQWCPRMLKLARITPEKLRPLSDAPTPVRGQLAAQYPELKDVPWFPESATERASNSAVAQCHPV
jgi:hypothetical protein